MYNVLYVSRGDPIISFFPTAFHPWYPDGGVGGWWEKVCPGCISETVRCRKLIRGRDIGFGGVGVQRHGLTLI